MKPVDPRVVTLLNEALTIELTVVNGYFLNARMLDNWGMPRLGKVFYDLSIGEMKDADELIERILMFDGHPNVQKLNNIQVGENAIEILELALDSELHAIRTFNSAAKECHDLGDHATANVFEQMALDEERHGDWFEAQLDASKRVGMEQYLAQQVDVSVNPA
ncbi:bacterioferritin [Janibacter corallicola]|uniref:bacterioferritin n=1 Tax=Janibacter corallicola TaxID=415212 RepID=UPI00082E18C4|nr:bacterioferritin [Janibacter corallicola]